MNWQGLSFWFSFGQWVVTLLIGAYVFLITRQRASQEQIRIAEQRAHERIDLHATRLARVEENIKHLPDATEINKIAVALEGLRAEYKGQGKLLEHYVRAVDRVNDFLLKDKGEL